MANRIIYVFILLQLFMSLSCNNVFEDERFTLVKSPNGSNILRLNGYYYNLDDSGVGVLFFYRNGVWIDGGWSESLENVEERIKDGSFYTMLTKRKYSWGLYLIDDSNIIQEQLAPTGGLSMIAESTYGDILNDSTIHYFKQKYSRSKGTITIDITYHFKEFAPKPDSINSFIH